MIGSQKSYVEKSIPEKISAAQPGTNGRRRSASCRQFFKAGEPHGTENARLPTPPHGGRSGAPRPPRLRCPGSRSLSLPAPQQQREASRTAARLAGPGRRGAHPAERGSAPGGAAGTGGAAHAAGSGPPHRPRCGGHAGSPEAAHRRRPAPPVTCPAPVSAALLQLERDGGAQRLQRPRHARPAPPAALTAPRRQRRLSALRGRGRREEPYGHWLTAAKRPALLNRIQSGRSTTSFPARATTVANKKTAHPS